MSTKHEKFGVMPGMVATTPDATFTRYQVDQFKTTKAKTVPYEELDFNIYKPASKCVAFATSEERILLWTRALHDRYYIGLQNNSMLKSLWEEQQTYNDSSKCDKVIIHLSLTSNAENIVAISVFTSTGRIQIQGRFLHEWGNTEFNTLLAMVNSPDKLLNESTTKDLDLFLQQLSETLDGDEPNEKPKKPSTCQTNDEFEIEESSNTPSSMTPSREKSFNMVKLNLASLESDFVSFKQHMTKTMEEMSAEIQHKDCQIKSLNERIASIEATQLLNDSAVTCGNLEKKVNNLTKQLNKVKDTHHQQDKSTSVSSCPTTNIQTISNTLHCPSNTKDGQDATLTCIYSIPTSNQFTVLDTHTCSSDGTPNTMEVANFDPDVQLTNNTSIQPTIINQPTSDQPETNQPASNQPEIEPPATNQQATTCTQTEINQPACNQPPPDQSEINQPETTQPENNQPATNQPATNQPTTNQPTSNRPTNNQPTNNKPATDKTAQSETTQVFPTERKNKHHNPNKHRSDTIILCDSNGRSLDLNLLCPGASYRYIRCPTLSKAKEILEHSEFHQPKTFIIHTGTNDLEKSSNSTLSSLTSDLLNIITVKFPGSRVLVSSLLPRDDNLHARVLEVNNQLKQKCLSMANVHLIEHTNLFQASAILYDKKHLNEKGVRLFAKNLKRAFFYNTPRRTSKTSMKVEAPHHPNHLHTPSRMVSPSINNHTYTPKPPINPHPYRPHTPPSMPPPHHPLRYPFPGIIPHQHSPYPFYAYPPNSNTPTSTKIHVPLPPFAPKSQDIGAPLLEKKMQHSNRFPALPPHFVELVNLLHGYIS